MIPPSIIMLNEKNLKSGLYESYYFRGNDEEGKISFWLKHNLLMYKQTPMVKVESTLIMYYKEKSITSVYKHAEDIPLDDYLAHPSLSKKTWDDIEYQFNDGSLLSLSKFHLRGELKTNKGNVFWDLKLKPCNQTYYHFSDDWYYHGFFPKKKILTVDTHLKFEGTLKTPEGNFTSTFLGMNGHNWGKEHAYKYTYGNCNQFNEDPEAYFDGFSAKIKLPGGIKSPFLSACSLKYKGEWFHFNHVSQSWRHDASEIEKETWVTKFINDTHELLLEIDGRDKLWVSLEYEHPSRAISIVNNTKFAEGNITLSERKTKKPIASLTSSLFELESLMP